MDRTSAGRAAGTGRRLLLLLTLILFLTAGNPVNKIPTIAGAGTIVTAFFMGPLIEFFNEKCARPMLNAKKPE